MLFKILKDTKAKNFRAITEEYLEEIQVMGKNFFGAFDYA